MVDATHLAAVVLSVLGAIAAAANHLFIRLGTDRGRAYDAVLVVMAVNVIVLLPLVAVWYYPNYHLTPVAWVSFILAGLVGSLLGRAFTYTSIERIGASRTAPIIASWALISTILGVVLLDETLTPIHGVGVVLVVGGVAAIAWETGHENPDDLSRRELLVGLLVPLGGVIAYGVEPIFAKWGFDAGTPSPVGLVVKMVAAVLGFTLYLHYSGALPARETYRSRDMRYFVYAGIASTAFLLAYYVALEISTVGIVSPIIVTNTLWVVVIAYFVMPERLERVTRGLVLAAVAVVVGVVLITASG